MAIVHKIPEKARFIPTENTFSAPFSGTYDFATAGNTNQLVLALDANTVYYIDNFSVGGNIAREDYLSAISVVPAIVLSRKLDKSSVYLKPIPLAQFYENKPCTCFVESNKKGDELQISSTGLLVQVANIIGVDPVKITVSFSIYAMDSSEYNKKFRDKDY
jgi:hypothetical protein